MTQIEGIDEVGLGFIDEGMDIPPELMDDSDDDLGVSPDQCVNSRGVLGFAFQRKAMMITLDRMNKDFNSSRRSRLIALVDTVKKQAEALEIDLHDLVDALKLKPRDKIDGRTLRGKMPPKYRSPDGLHHWSGMGRQPLWVEAAIKEGHTKESLLISEASSSK